MKQFTLIEKAFLLKKSTPFQELDLNLLLAIADKLGTTYYRKGDTVFAEKDEATRMYFIVEGEIALFDHEKRQLECLAPNDYFGDEALFYNGQRAYTAESTKTSYLLTLSRTHLYNIIAECPSVALGFLREYAHIVPRRSHHSQQEPQ